MRIYFDGHDDKTGKNYSMIEEFVSVSISSAWKSDSDGTGIPDHLYITLTPYNRVDDDCDDAGEYRLDGTEETFNKAMSDYNKAIESLLTKGYARESDFGDVEWY